MGNVPGKEERQNQVDTRRRSNSGVSVSAVRDILNPSATHRKKKLAKEKEALKEEAMKGLIVKSEETVDGGYLAPYGVYTPNQDYSIDVVRKLIIDRKLAPFYTPLQDFEETWTDEELLKELNALELHAVISDEIEENSILDPGSKHYKKQLNNRMFEKSLIDKRIEAQKEAQYRYDRAKSMSKKGFKKENVPSNDLLLRLYKTAKECPICFVFYPDNLNKTRCCVHPICTECFVQIKRPDPHPPHDERSQNNNNQPPKDLISEPAKCPFCAMPNFGVTYTPLPDVKTGFGGILPCEFKLDSALSDCAIDETDEIDAKTEPPKRRHSLPPEHASVIATDFIRPDWERKLNSARMKLARRSAAATAIHASSLLMDENANGQQRTGRSYSNADMEQKMIEEALRLSLLEEEERLSRQNGDDQ